MKKKGGSMTSPKGMYSSKSSTMGTGKMNTTRVGPSLCGGNSDQSKVGSLRTKAYAEKDSLRGKNGI